MDVDLAVRKITFTNQRNKISHSFTLAHHYQDFQVYVFVSLYR